MKSCLNVPAAVALAMALASALFAGCLDFTPLTVPPSDGGAAETSTGDSGRVNAAACQACVEGAQSDASDADSLSDSGLCSKESQACASTPKCHTMFECGVSRGCYAPGAMLVACLTICGQQAGVTGESDPAVGPFIALYDCATVKCAAACAGR